MACRRLGAGGGVLILAAAGLVSAAVLVAGARIASALRPPPAEGGGARALQVLATFAPAVGAGSQDPRALLVWEALARTGRRLLPEEFARLDQAAGGVFPFSRERLQAAHAAWTADWLAWERTHDTEYKLKAATIEHDLAASGGSPVFRARLDAVEREKLDLYQRRYEEYIRVAKALQALF